MVGPRGLNFINPKGDMIFDTERVMTEPDLEKLQLQTAAYIHEVALMLSCWADARKLEKLTRLLQMAAAEAAEFAHDNGGHRPPPGPG